MKKKPKKIGKLKKHVFGVNNFALEAADYKEKQGEDWTIVVTDPRSCMKKGTNIAS